MKLQFKWIDGNFIDISDKKPINFNDLLLDKLQPDPSMVYGLTTQWVGNEFKIAVSDSAILVTFRQFDFLLRKIVRKPLFTKYSSKIIKMLELSKNFTEFENDIRSVNDLDETFDELRVYIVALLEYYKSGGDDTTYLNIGRDFSPIKLSKELKDKTFANKFLLSTNLIDRRKNFLPLVIDCIDEISTKTGDDIESYIKDHSDDIKGRVAEFFRDVGY